MTAPMEADDETGARALLSWVALCLFLAGCVWVMFRMSGLARELGGSAEAGIVYHFLLFVLAIVLAVTGALLAARQLLLRHAPRGPMGVLFLMNAGLAVLIWFVGY